jgi:hypothetical protein
MQKNHSIPVVRTIKPKKPQISMFPSLRTQRSCVFLVLEKQGPDPRGR